MTEGRATLHAHQWRIESLELQRLRNQSPDRTRPRRSLDGVGKLLPEPAKKGDEPAPLRT